jgi:hypothetical protein
MTTTPTTAPDPADTAVSAAFSAGWLIAQLYGPIMKRDDKADTRHPLPTVRELGRTDRIALACDELDALIAGKLNSALTANNATAPSTAAVKSAASTLVPPTAFNAAVVALHVQLLKTLTVADGGYGTAYSLGRSLSDTCWLPKEQSDYERQFNKYRLSNLQSWLSGISHRLPDQTAGAVAAGLDHWAAWLDVRQDIDWTKDQTTIENATRAQGEKWRGLLAGETKASSLLTPEGYIVAGEAALHRASAIIRRTVRHFWVPLVIVFALVALIVVLAIVYGDGATTVWTSIVSIAAGFGVTGKSLQSTAKSLASDASKPLLQLAEVDAIGWAATTLPAITTPRPKQRALRRLGVEPPSTLLASAAVPPPNTQPKPTAG